jgi:hypothetical protein
VRSFRYFFIGRSLICFQLHTTGEDGRTRQSWQGNRVSAPKDSWLRWVRLRSPSSVAAVYDRRRERGRSG